MHVTDNLQENREKTKAHWIFTYQFITNLLHGLQWIKLKDRHPFNSLFSRTTWVSLHQKGYTNLDFNEATDDGVAVALDGNMQIICILLQIDNHASTLMPNQQCQSNEGKERIVKTVEI